MRWKYVEECLGGVWEAGRGLRGFFWCGHGRLWSMGFGDGWRGGGVWVAVVGVSVSWRSGQSGGGLQSSGSGISAELGPGRQESLRLLRCLSLDQLLLGAVEGGVVVREEGRKGQGGRAWEQAVGGG